ncbi:acyl transferase/acyl hydrolase/lysophospholipase [Nemania abortiva]|nr:acyl transferase/acyl hydrolase/lysophospholipase [Nemania abortiva]
MDGPAAIPPAGRDDHNLNPWIQKVVLSLGSEEDGGGIRGYWSLLVLDELMQSIKREELARDEPARSSFHPCEEPLNISRVSPTPATPFLPCHYLITILLSRFRMTVDDCLDECKRMAGSVFGHHNLIYSLKFGIGGNKFRRDPLERAIKEVIERREERRTEDHSGFLFRTEIDTCRGIVLATRINDSRFARSSFLFRSYTPFSEKSRQHSTWQVDEPQNHLEGSKIVLIKAALAATAAPLYFGSYRCTLSATQIQAAKRVPTRHGTTIFSSSSVDAEPADKKFEYEFEDAGFSLVNNPCAELEREIKHHHGQEISPILVSIGTARPQPRDQRNYLARVTRRAFAGVGDPEPVHDQMRQRSPAAGNCYFRFNDEQGIAIEMDDWKPKDTGERTLQDMQNKFLAWVHAPEVREKFTTCARTLVDLRRARMTTPRWERFALVRYFECKVNWCPKDRDNRWLDRADFRNHLDREHKPTDYEGSIDEAVESYAHEWEYRT